MPLKYPDDFRARAVAFVRPGQTVAKTAEDLGITLASMVDQHTRESILDITDRSISSEKIIDCVKKVIAQRGAPTVLRCDYEPEFISHALNEFTVGQIDIHYIPPGQPWRNGNVEFFNSRMRDEWLKANSFDHIYEARAIKSNCCKTTTSTTGNQSSTT